MKNILFIIFFISSCSSLNKAKFYGGLGGSVAGAGIGLGVGQLVGSKNGFTSKSNILTGLIIGTITGLISGTLIADFFWNEDPENREMKQMILKTSHQKISVDNIADSREKGLQKAFENINPQVKIYQAKTEPVPHDLQNKIQQQKIIIYNLPEQTFHLKNGRTVVVKSTEAKEHFYEDPQN